MPGHSLQCSGRLNSATRITLKYPPKIRPVCILVDKRDRYLTSNNSVSLAGDKIQEGKMQLSGKSSEDDYFSWKQLK